jgi:RNA polymerase sigma-70 factor (ECF subfamily)
LVDYQGLEDFQLIQRTATGDAGALEELYSRYSTAVYSLARYMLRNEASAEDATQDVFVNIWTKAASYRPDRGAPKSWVMSVAHNKIIDIIRSQRRHQNMGDQRDYETLDILPSGSRSTEQQAELNLEGERIRRALDTLPDGQRAAIMLSYYEGYSQSEIAAKLDLPLGTVKTRMRLAMQKLRSELEADVI